MRVKIIKLLLLTPIFLVISLKSFSSSNDVSDVYYRCKDAYVSSVFYELDPNFIFSGHPLYPDDGSQSGAVRLFDRLFISDDINSVCHHGAVEFLCAETHQEYDPNEVGGAPTSGPLPRGEPEPAWAGGPDYAAWKVYCEVGAQPDVRVHFFSRPYVCESPEKFNPIKNRCETYTCGTGETWALPAGDCGPATPPPCGKNCGCGTIGNPCDPGTGNKYQSETDYQGTDPMLSIVRSYNSRSLKDNGFGPGWTAGFLPSLTITADEVIVWQQNGRTDVFTGGNGNWSTDADSDLTLSASSDFTLTHTTGRVQTYSPAGRLLSQMTPSGQTTHYNYNADGQLTSVTNPYGQSLTLTWNQQDHIATITDPHGGVYTYDYGPLHTLKSVTYPGGAQRQYHYEHESLPAHLTGITDENGDRYATFAYDSEGRAVSTEHADTGGGGAQERFQIDYTQ